MTNLYNGYTESESMTAQRAFSRQMEAQGYKIQRPTSTLLNTEAEVDRVRDLIDCAELNDAEQGDECNCMAQHAYMTYVPHSPTCPASKTEHPVDAAQSIEQAIDATLHAEDSRFKKLGGYVKPTYNANGHTETIQNAIDKGQLDANGQMLPYKASGVVGKSWDDHEIHSYTVDGE